MRKILCFLLAVTLVLSLTACNSTSTGGTTESSSQALADDSQMTGSETDTAGPAGRVLVAYFSWAENAILEEDVDAEASPSVVSPGNVQQLAGWVQEATGGDLFSIQVTDPYPSDWDACLSRANEERREDARPELVENVDHLEQYDTVFLGYPNWWYGVPMALLSFLEENDLSGKQVYLFCSHGTGGLANSVEIITEAALDAVISENIFDCYEEDASSSQEAIVAWVEGLGYAVENPEENEEAASEETEKTNTMAQQITIQFGEHTVVYELNDSEAAQDLYDQLPLTVEVEDFSTNEKIFYPPNSLDTADVPLASNGSGTLAYYEPWGDVVMFYGDYSQNPSLYELGHVVSGGELVSEMAGTITISAAD
ncbi:MAG TPA: hypothetical protein IAB23_05580 [Candidatus Scybalocola faecavium]|nr:hypothetical protein [Candidatus Scybalocola faecavium]